MRAYYLLHMHGYGWYDQSMTTNTAYLGRYDARTHGYVIEAVAQGKRKGKVIASFPTYAQMLQAWLRVTDLEGMTDVVFND